MNILIIEDTEAHSDDLMFALRKHYGHETSFVLAAYEQDFEYWFQQIANDDNTYTIPEFALIDIMLPYRPLRADDYLNGERLDTPGPINEAGFRCANKLLASPLTKNIPFIFYTAFPPDLVSGWLKKFKAVPHKRKDNDYESLIRLINKEITKKTISAKQK